MSKIRKEARHYLYLPPVRDRDIFRKTIAELVAVLIRMDRVHVPIQMHETLDVLFRSANGSRSILQVSSTLTTGRQFFLDGNHPKALACYLWLLLRNHGNYAMLSELHLESPYTSRPLTLPNGEIDWPYVVKVFRSMHGTPAKKLMSELPPVVLPSMGDRRQSTFNFGKN